MEPPATDEPGHSKLSLHDLEQRLGWRFQDPNLLVKALTHATYAHEHPHEGPAYERLEFLGDAVLNVVAARLLFDAFDHASEGELTQRRAKMVRDTTLAQLAQRLELTLWIRVGEGLSRTHPRILADTFEALAGAVFLDGGFEAASRCFAVHLMPMVQASEQPIDFKTQLQELCHKLGLPGPVYKAISEEGPAHARYFVWNVLMDGHVYGQGAGASKKIAQQQSAQEALSKLQAKLPGVIVEERKSP